MARSQLKALDTIIDRVWAALRPALFRRAMIGSVGIAELTMLAVRHCPSAALQAAHGNEGQMQLVLQQWEQLVHAGFAFNATRRNAEMSHSYGAVRWVVVVPWAVQLVVLFVCELVVQGEVDIDKLHKECGWNS
jgi:hypothetical protein